MFAPKVWAVAWGNRVAENAVTNKDRMKTLSDDDKAEAKRKARERVQASYHLATPDFVGCTALLPLSPRSPVSFLA